MTKPKDRDRKALAVRPASANRGVGYGKPPEGTRFKPGQSGNPKGRPKGAKNKRPALHEERLKGILLDEAYRTIKINDGNRQVSVPMAKAVIRALAVNAVKGSHRAQRIFTQLLTVTERENKRLHDEWLDTAMTYKVEWDRELARRKQLGITGPEPIPHPDHIVIDMRTGEVAIKGPFTREQKAEIDLWVARKAEFEAELEDDQRLLEEETDPGIRSVIEGEIEHTQRVLVAIRRLVPD